MSAWSNMGGMRSQKRVADRIRRGVHYICAVGPLVIAAPIATLSALPARSQTAVSPSADTLTAATAQLKSASFLEELIVTARRKEESLQTVPLSITALSKDALKEQSIADAFDLGRAVSGLTVLADSGNSSLPIFGIRGRGLNYGAAAGSVETYFADVPLSPPFETPTLPPQYFDLQIRIAAHRRLHFCALERRWATRSAYCIRIC
jgi:iron complex outermembrane receptor protein